MSHRSVTDCASVMIAGSGTSTLDHLPDMFVGDMTLTRHIGAGECRSTAGYALEYPDPGNAVTVTTVQSIGFKKPSSGKCYAKGTAGESTTSAVPSSTQRSSSTTSSKYFMLLLRKLCAWKFTHNVKIIGIPLAREIPG
jgi:hypothetical protein